MVHKLLLNVAETLFKGAALIWGQALIKGNTVFSFYKWEVKLKPKLRFFMFVLKIFTLCFLTKTSTTVIIHLVRP